MTTREEIQHLTIEELNKAYKLLVQCLHILNFEDMGLCDLSNNGKDMILSLEFAKLAILSRIIEIEKTKQK